MEGLPPFPDVAFSELNLFTHAQDSHLLNRYPFRQILLHKSFKLLLYAVKNVISMVGSESQCSEPGYGCQ